MNINNAIMLNIGMVRTQWAKKNFDFSQLWAAVTDGTMLSFQQTLPRTDLTREIIKCLEAAPNPTFLKGGRMDYEALSLSLSPFWENSYGMDDQFFLPRNDASVNELCKLADLTPAAARDIYLFLLLHLQVKPKELIREGDLHYLLTQLETAPRTAAPSGRLLAVLRGTPLRAMGCEVQSWQGQWKTIFTADAPIVHLCAGDGVGFLAVSADGKLYAPECPQAVNAAKGLPITSASAFGSHYALLAEGKVITSVPEIDWEDVHEISLGLNSIAAITGPLRRVVGKNCHEKLASFTDVKSVSTRTDGKCRHYAVLRQSGELHLSFGTEVLTGVTCAALCHGGCLYIREDALSLRSTDGETRLLRTLPDLTVQTLTVRDNLILLGDPDTPIAVSL